MADNTGAKRTSNPAQTTMRSLCFARGEKRKAERRQAQAAREEVNGLVRTLGMEAPWERSKAARKAKRAADPEVQARRARWNHGRGPSAA